MKTCKCTINCFENLCQESKLYLSTNSTLAVDYSARVVRNTIETASNNKKLLLILTLKGVCTHKIIQFDFEIHWRANCMPCGSFRSRSVETFVLHHDEVPQMHLAVQIRKALKEAFYFSVE